MLRSTRSTGGTRWPVAGPVEDFRQWLPLASQSGEQGRGCPGIEVAESPRLGLWVMGIKVRNKFRIRKMPQSRAVVRHAISIPRDIETS